MGIHGDGSGDELAPRDAVGQAELVRRGVGTQDFQLKSVAVGDRLRVTVSPGTPGSPALYVLDPILLFDLAVGVATLLRSAAQFTGGPFPNLTVVGVGYPTDDPGAVFALRARDLTPTDGSATTAFPLPPLRYGGAAAFLEARADEAVPQVESRYQTDPTHRGLVGFSFGGLFALYTLFHCPELFFGYVIGSPSLWWDDGIASRWEEAWARDHADLVARIFLSAGANEQTVGDTWKNEGFPLEILQRVAEVDRVRSFADRLRGRGYPSLQLEAAVFEGEYHLTAPPAMFTRGLLTDFENEKDVPVTSGAEAIDMGTPPDNEFRELVQQLMNAGWYRVGHEEGPTGVSWQFQKGHTTETSSGNVRGIAAPNEMAAMRILWNQVQGEQVGEES